MWSTTQIDPSPGPLSKRDPVGASPVGHADAIVSQLRGRCGARDVDTAARFGLIHSRGSGGNLAGLVLTKA